MVMQEYNGWTNFPTWAVNAFINDTPERQAFGRAIAHRKNLMGIDRDDLLKEWIKSKNPWAEMGYRDVGVYGELLDWALDNVNWTEIEKALEED